MVTGVTGPVSQAKPLVRDFPQPGTRIEIAYRELHLAQYGTPEQKQAVGDFVKLARPWDPASVTTPEMRQELWEWLDAFVTWLNHEYSWDVGAAVPPCWPAHPHLVHEIAVLADQRRRAGLALTSDGFEEWHRYVLPTFVDRMRARIKSHCEERHQDWPGRARHARHAGEDEATRRSRLYRADMQTVRPAAREEERPAPRLHVVDTSTGEIHD